VEVSTGRGATEDLRQPLETSPRERSTLLCPLESGLIEPICDDNLDAALSTLACGFPAKPREFWAGFMDRQYRLGGNAAAGVPLGYVLRSKQDAVGVILTPASLRVASDGTQRRLINLSSWYVDAAHRWRAANMLRSVLNAQEAVYIDLTPTEEVAKMLTMLGFELFRAGTAFYVLPLAALRLRDDATVEEYRDAHNTRLSDEVARMLDAHRRIGCDTAILDCNRGCRPLIFATRWIRRVRTSVLVYCDDHAALREHRASVARWLLRRGAVALLLDHSPDEGLTGHWHAPRGRRFVRGPDASLLFKGRTDYAWSEFCLMPA
jgi:hypothetical protein